MGTYADYMDSLPDNHPGVDGTVHEGKPSIWCYQCGGPAADWPPSD